MITGIIYIDGPDACGKTTLAMDIKKYVENNGGKVCYLHATYRFPEKMLLYQEAILRLAIKKSKDHLVIIDRLHWSERVYADVYRGGSQIPLLWRPFDRILQKHGALTIIAVPPNLETGIEWHQETKKERGEMYNDITLVIEKYYQIALKFGNRKDYLIYQRNLFDTDLRKLSLIDVILRKVQNLRETQFPSALSPDTYNYLGHLDTATYIIISEYLNPTKRHLIWPHHIYIKTNVFLNKTLEYINFDETSAIWTAGYLHKKYGNKQPHFLQIIGKKPSLIPIMLSRLVYNNYKKYLPDKVYILNAPGYERKVSCNDFKKYGEYWKAILEND